MKKKRKKKRSLFLVCFFALFFGGGITFYVYGQTGSSSTATNVVTIGKVAVELKMDKENAGKIVPGQTEISNVVTVGNIGEYPAYIRMFVKKYWKITKDGQELTKEQIDNAYPNLSVNAIEIQLKDKWTKGNASPSYQGYDCYYYNEVVGTNQKEADAIHFSDSYKVVTEQNPGDGGITNDLLEQFVNDGATVCGYYSVIVEAIQADAFTPDTSSVGGNTIITDWADTLGESVVMPPINIDPDASVDRVVNFVSENAEIPNADDFIHIENLLPGQTEEKVVEIKNTSNQKLPVYVYAETADDYNSLTDDQKEWLQQLQLFVTKKDGTSLYSGSLYKSNSKGARFSSNNQIEIGEFSPGERENLYIAIHCPASWDKGDVQVKVNWIFSSKKAIPNPTKRPSGGGGGPIIIVTNTPVVTEEPVMETEVPETNTPEPDTPEPTETPEVTLLPTATLEVIASPIVTQIPTEKPKEPNVIVTETPDWEEVEEETSEPKTPEPTNRVTEVPSPPPEAAEEIKPLESGEPDNIEPIETLEMDPTSDDRPRRTSTPKLPTIVEEVYPTKTGDATPIVVWLALFVVSLGGMFAAVTAYRKRM